MFILELSRSNQTLDFVYKGEKKRGGGWGEIMFL